MGIVFDYINKRIEKRELNLILNSINLVEVSKKEIRSMGKNINADIWTTHKKKVLLSWMKSHEKFEHKHQNRAKKYIKKLEIEVDDQIEKLQAHGIKWVTNVNSTAGQEVFHTHIHLIPYYEMSIPEAVADQKILNQIKMN